jgi:hypothetical protein
VGEISNISQTLLESLGITQTSNLTQAQWNKVTEKVNSYVKSILRNANTNKQQNAEEAIYRLEGYLRKQLGKDYVSIEQPLREYARIAKFADPVIKNGKLTGFKLKSSDGVVEAIYDSNRGIINRAVSGMVKALWDIPSIESNTTSAVTKYITSTNSGKKAVDFVARNLSKDGKPSLSEVALARKLIIKAVSASLKTARMGTREYSPDTQKNKKLEFDLSGTKEKK